MLASGRKIEPSTKKNKIALFFTFRKWANFYFWKLRKIDKLIKADFELNPNNELFISSEKIFKFRRTPREISGIIGECRVPWRHINCPKFQIFIWPVLSRIPVLYISFCLYLEIIFLHMYTPSWQSQDCVARNQLSASHNRISKSSMTIWHTLLI